MPKPYYVRVSTGGYPYPRMVPKGCIACTATPSLEEESEFDGSVFNALRNLVGKHDIESIVAASAHSQSRIYVMISESANILVAFEKIAQAAAPHVRAIAREN